MFSYVQRKKLFCFRRTIFKNFRKTEKIKLERTQCKCPLEEVVAYRYTDFLILSYSSAGRLKGKGGSLTSNTSCTHLPVVHTYRKLLKVPNCGRGKGKEKFNCNKN